MDASAPAEVGLFCNRIVKDYGKIKVLKSIDFSLRPGNVVGLIGENGAGKSTFNAIIAGIVSPTEGQIWLDGTEYRPRSPSEALQKGVALIHQEIRLLPRLSVAENLFMGRLPMRGGRVDRARMEEESRAILGSLGVTISPRRVVNGLTMAVQQSIEIAKALLRKPRYIIFDEPTATLGEVEAEQILEHVRRLRTEGTGVIYVSHRLDEIQSVADQVVCLRDGAMVARWEEKPVPKEQMINAMVGREFTFEHHAPKPRGQKVVLKVDGAARQGAFRDVSFELLEGEILGFAGLVGAGRTDVVRAISGADRLDSGEIWVAGQRVNFKSPRGAMDAGIFMVPEDRKGLGLNLDRSAAANITLPWERKLARFGQILPSTVRKVGEQQRKRFDIRGRLDLPVGFMSGGNQQKVLLAKWLVEAPKVFIVDEPTRGVDVGAKMAIYEILRSLASSGMGVIVVSSELEEVLGLSHRILVMSEGRQCGILSREEASPEKVMALAVGGRASSTSDIQQG
ncbi:MULTISPECIES: sugar ABC transporter ATP-binding protein [unclassified Shinella]|uniref:sugar ABC transporter ATP-binding protein n=1 Tax=unclassified Shinella TaxID=2643062 RepID=UPI00225D5910|nr:sugar ABC transporter ATP-binding protein [Shinella sp. YE25]MDC7258735.1 sugar ABC transporter ATP-binding protein [Shinella sp. YE25]CAI0334500.1 Ribose import ATP-binding protein RbsA [Rhizobiaceae bacterium]CAK7260676.1 Ribose import ATP-binding protein RbsA [Shinella sp. WSC3-e]